MSRADITPANGTYARTLRAFNGRYEMLNAELAEAMGLSVKSVQTYVQRTLVRGYLIRLNPGSNPARHRISDKGHELLANLPKPQDKQKECDGIVAQAMRTQPNSVFGMGWTA